jgi:polyisoprenoid-binding protein YceI
MTFPRGHVAAALALALATGPPWADGAVDWAADADASTIAVVVSRKGVLSGLSHGHRFVPGRWVARAHLAYPSLAGTSVEVMVDTASLHDQEPRLGAASRAEVDRTTAGPEVLDATRFPTVRYAAEEVADVRVSSAGDVEATLRGTLSLHGVDRSLDVRVRARPEGAGIRVNGTATFPQSAFGMKPYTTALGTIGVDDPVHVEFDLLLRRGEGTRASWSE